MKSVSGSRRPSKRLTLSIALLFLVWNCFQAVEAIILPFLPLLHPLMGHPMLVGQVASGVIKHIVKPVLGLGAKEEH